VGVLPCDQEADLDVRDTRNETFGALLRRYREAAGFTQEDLALRAGLSANGVSQLERGERRRPYPHTVSALSGALDLPENERASLLAAIPKRESAPHTSSDLSEQRLPTPSTPLLGRERELGEVGGLLEEVRLLTLTGTGGVGKTRLAVEAARVAQAAGTFPDGVAFVALAPLVDPGLVLPAVLRSLGLKETEALTPQEDLSAYLREKRLLLVLDNFEHLLRAAPEVAALIESCPRLAVLATSRAPLRVRGEQEYPVLPLALPRSTVSSAVEEVAGSPSGSLFVERARAVSPAFVLDRNNAATVAAICRRLAGLPLALELAAAGTRFMGPGDLLARLDEALLAGGFRDLPPRQQTMRATLDWSRDLLTDAEKALFQRLSVFAGGFTLDAAEAVGAQTDGETSGGPVVGLLGTLVEQSLVAAKAGADGGEARYGMLEPVRQYGLELLDHGDDDEEEETRRRHARYYLDLTERAATEFNGPRQAAWSHRLEEEHDNLRAALSWAIEGEENGLRLAGNLGEFWYTRGYAREGLWWLEAALTRGAGAQEASARSRALTWATTLAWTQGDLERATALGEEGLALARDMGDPSNMAAALFAVGRAALFADRLGRASELIEEAAAFQRASGDAASLARSLMLLGWATEARGDHGRAMALREEALALSLKAEDDFTTVYLWALGAFAALGLGDHRRARELGKEGLELSRQRNMRRHTAVHLHVLASLESQQGRPIRSARLTGAAEAMYRGIDNVFNSVEGRLFGPYTATSRARIGDAAWESARNEGREMTPERAVAYALAKD
jgi:predicted ATPase/DNA-binding XRE family transcriptional regulator